MVPVTVEEARQGLETVLHFIEQDRRVNLEFREVISLGGLMAKLDAIQRESDRGTFASDGIYHDLDA